MLWRCKNEERGDSALNQAWTCSLWTCPDIKQSWNLTHTSYIDLHSHVIPFEGPWLFLYASVCKVEMWGCSSYRKSFWNLSGIKLLASYLMKMRSPFLLNHNNHCKGTGQTDITILMFSQKAHICICFDNPHEFWDACHQGLNRLPQATFCCLNHMLSTCCR